MPFLMKAEPESRIEKGKDVKFSIHDLEAMGESPWDGVRNHVAKNIQKSMKLNDKVLFYHSNCKVPGVYGLATVSKEAYPDYTAWDPAHPYFDPRSSASSPTWYMVSVQYHSTLPFPPTLLLIKTLASAPSLPACVEYIGETGWREIKDMMLIKQGRLSVQSVSQEAYDAIVLLGIRGGWDELVAKPVKAKRKLKTQAEGDSAPDFPQGEANGAVEPGDSPASKLKGKRKSSAKAKVEMEDVSKIDDGGESSLSPAPEEKPVPLMTNVRGKRKSMVKPDEAESQLTGDNRDKVEGSRKSKRTKA